MPSTAKQLLLVLSGFLSLMVTAQKSQLTNEQYFKNNFKGIIQPLPNVTHWIDNSNFLLIRNNKTYVINAKDGSEKEATGEDLKVTRISVKPEAIIKDNDIFLKTDSVIIQLTHDSSIESNPTISPDVKFVAYTKNNDLYTVDLNTKKEKRLTFDGSGVILNGYSSWVYMEEILGRSTNYKAFWWSPDSKYIAFFRSDDSDVPTFTITDGEGQHGYVRTMRYPKVGDKNPEVKIGIVEPAGSAITWSDFNEKNDQYFGMPYWKPDGSALLVQWMNRKQNNLKIWEVDPANGKKQLFYNEEQKAWIDLDDEGSRIIFLNNGKGLLLLNDATGYRHIYYHDMKGNLINPVTTGNLTVTDIQFVDENKKVIYFIGRGKENSARKDLYRISFKGKNLQRLTFGDYNHTIISFSPDASYFVTIYGNTSTPNRMAIVDKNGKVIKDIADQRGPDFEKYELARTELIRVKSEDGRYDLPMKVTWPVNMDKNKKYPVLLYQSMVDPTRELLWIHGNLVATSSGLQKKV
jgi:dipeptidyl-peptidase 4